MPSMRASSIVVSALSLGLAAAPAGAQHPTDRLDWLAGCWQRRTASGVVEEHWMRPRGGQLLGMGRTTRAGAVREWEFLRIYAAGDTLIFAAEPSGQQPAEFRMTPTGDTARVLRFENLAHDFPQRVLYRAAGRDSLIARVEGMRNGQLRGVDFAYARTSCEP